MNFQDLLAKMKQIDESPIAIPVNTDGAGAGDECDKSMPNGEILATECPPTGMEPKNEPQGDMLTGECGDMGPQASAPKQSDSVTMNVSMNGSGAGGIRDLMAILKNIEHGGASEPHHDADVLVGMGAEEGFQDATTTPHPQTAGVDAMTRTGDDLSSKGKEAVKVNGGGNPMRESLVAKLSAMYEEVKNEAYNPNSASAENRRNLDKHEHDRLKAAAEKDDATDADKARYKRYQDRKAATKAAYDAEMER